MDLSIIIVSWNAKGHLINCLNSLSKLNRSDWEIIVVDNNSEDGSHEEVETKFPHVKLIKNKENLGFAKANNIGIRASSGRYICLINSDVIVLDGCIEKLIEFMDKNPSVGMSGPRILNPDHTLQHNCFHFPSIRNNLSQALGLNKLFPKSPFFSEQIMKYWPHDCERRVDALNGCFLMVRRKAIDEVGLLDEDFFFYGEDIDWCRQFRDSGWEVVFYPEAATIHFGGASSSNAPVKFYLEMQKADLQYWRKHHGRLGQSVYWMIILLRQLVRLPVYVLIYIFRPGARRGEALFKLKRALTCIRWLFTCLGEKM
jgi:GT2 family glycosyltransferase